MIDDEILRNVVEIIGSLASRPATSVSMATKAADIDGWDSMKQVMFVMAVEERFHIRLQNRDIDQLNSVGNTVKIIVSKLAAKGEGS